MNMIHPANGQRINEAAGGIGCDNPSRSCRNLTWDSDATANTVTINPEARKLELWGIDSGIHGVTNDPVILDINADMDTGVAPTGDEVVIIAMLDSEENNPTPLYKFVDASRFPGGIVYPETHDNYVGLGRVPVSGASILMGGEYIRGQFIHDSAVAFSVAGTGASQAVKHPNIPTTATEAVLYWTVTIGTLDEALEVYGSNTASSSPFTVHKDTSGNKLSGMIIPRIKSTTGEFFVKFPIGVTIEFSPYMHTEKKD